MRLPQLLCLAMLVTSSSSKGQADGERPYTLKGQGLWPGWHDGASELGEALARTQKGKANLNGSCPTGSLSIHTRWDPALKVPPARVFTGRTWTTASSEGTERATALELNISMTYKVLKVYPQSRHILLMCHAPRVLPPITYVLLASQGIQMAKKVVQTQQPASFTLNVTLKSSPDLLTYSCQAASPTGMHGSSAPLRLYWELWAKPVSHLRANITLHGGGPGPRAEMSCWASSGSPPITYRLVSKDGKVHMQQRPLHGQPANFSFLLPPAPGWFQCQAENSMGVQSSALTLVPPGELPQGPVLVLAGSLLSIAAVASRMLGWIRL